MLARARARTLSLAATLALAACASMTGAASASASSASPPPSGAWSRFTSDLSGAAGLATGQGVRIAVLCDGADTSVDGLGGGKVTNGPDYVYKPRISLAHSLTTLEAALILGAPQVSTGVAPSARILSERVEPVDNQEPGSKQFFDSDTYVSTEPSVLAKAIRYAVDHDATVIEVDPYVGNDVTTVDGSALLSAVDYALAKNVVIVAPEGGTRQGTQPYVYPAGTPGVIGVSSVMLPGGMPPSVITTGPVQSPGQSARNNSVVIAGPGDFRQVAADGWGIYGLATAVAYVTGTVALIKQRYPDLSPALVERALAMSARYHPPGGYSTQTGFGVLDPYDAVLDAGTLTKLTVAAGPGDTVTGPGTHFGAGPLPGTVYALPSALNVIIASWAGVGVGAALLVLAVMLAVRRRQRRMPPSTL